MANSIERIGVYHCGKIAEQNGWMFREQPIDDVGIDAHMELTEPTGESKQLLALQIKSGASWFKEEKGESFIFRDINERQYGDPRCKYPRSQTRRRLAASFHQAVGHIQCSPTHF